MIDKNEPEKVDLHSMSMTDEQKLKLKQLFPHAFNEDQIDFEKLRLTLGDEVDTGLERYGMTWPGKAECMGIIRQPSIATLKPCKEESVNFDGTENLFIEGDNLEVLKLLQKSYYGKVKMIYIDPPYNTGNEFIYPDKYSETLDTYLSYTGQVDDKGIKFSTNTDTDGRYHSKWLNMMYPRLFLARNLLRDDGVIFVSIDDNEVDNLKKMCNEIFGEENFFSEMVWKNKTGGGAKTKGWIGLHEYILCYAKNIDSIIDVSIPYSEKTASMYNKKDENYSVRGPYATWPLNTTSMGDRPNLRYPILHEGQEIWPEKQWLWSENRVLEAQQNGMLEFNKQKDNSYKIRFKGYLRDENGIMRRGKPLSLFDGPYTQEGSNDFKDLLPKSIFPFPKPVQLLSQIFSISTTDGNDTSDIILDFFSGSSTTAHAVLEINKKEHDRLKFICVQLPEPCDEKSEAYKAGYKNIADIGKERIRRVIKKIEDEQKQDSAQTTLTDESTEKHRLDLGFKVFKLDKSNFNIWDGAIEDDATGEDITKQLKLIIENIDPNSSEEDILYELLLKSGFQLTTGVNKIELAGKKVYSIENDALLICLDRELNNEVITEMAKKEPARVICLDEGFSGNDQLKTNAVQIMKSFNVEDFGTV